MGEAGAGGGPYPFGMRRCRSGGTPKVLVANEPLSYRQAMARVLRAVRPDLRVDEAEPDALERALRDDVPHLVICSRATPAVRRISPAWIELYPDHGPLCSFSVAGRTSTVRGLDLDEMLALVDKATLLTV